MGSQDGEPSVRDDCRVRTDERCEVDGPRPSAPAISVRPEFRVAAFGRASALLRVEEPPSQPHREEPGGDIAGPPSPGVASSGPPRRPQGPADRRTQPAPAVGAVMPSSSGDAPSTSSQSRPRWRPLGRCERCREPVTSWKHYLQHLTLQHNLDFSRHCVLCLSPVTPPSMPQHHTHHLRKKDRFGCTECDADFLKKKAFRRHMTMFHGIAPLF